MHAVNTAARVGGSVLQHRLAHDILEQGQIGGTADRGEFRKAEFGWDLTRPPPFAKLRRTMLNLFDEFLALAGALNDREVVWVVSRDGLIALKRKAARPQDLADIARLEALP